MGMEYTIRFHGGTAPPLARVLAVLAEHNFPAQMRMVDGELTLPDEAPPERWKEVRLGTSSGMVSLVRRGGEIAVVTWGNADEAMQRAWNAVAWAVAKAGTGEIILPGGPKGPDDFRKSVALPNVLRE
jgi:hypothetical protein